MFTVFVLVLPMAWIDTPKCVIAACSGSATPHSIVRLDEDDAITRADVTFAAGPVLVTTLSIVTAPVKFANSGAICTWYRVHADTQCIFNVDVSLKHPLNVTEVAFELSDNRAV